MNRFRLQLIEWLDHTEGDSNWQSPSEEMEITHCFSVGWVMAENQHVVKLVPHMGSVPDEEGGYIYSSPLKIAKGAILARKDLQ